MALLCVTWVDFSTDGKLRLGFRKFCDNVGFYLKGRQFIPELFRSKECMFVLWKNEPRLLN